MNKEKQSSEQEKKNNTDNPPATEDNGCGAVPDSAPQKKREIGGRKGLEPTRFGDWELGGKCVDF